MGDRTKWPKMPLILLGVSAALGFGVYVWDAGRSPVQETPSGPNAVVSTAPMTGVALFPGLREGDVQAVEVRKGMGEKQALEDWVLRLERGDRGWQVREPIGPANEATVAFLTSLLVGQGQQLPEVTGDRLAEFGLDRPVARISFRTASSATLQSIVLGQPNFDRSLRYALINAAGSGGAAAAEFSAQPEKKYRVWLVSPSFVQAIDRPMGEWRD